MMTLKQTLELELAKAKDRQNDILVIGRNRTATYNWACRYFKNSHVYKTNNATRESRLLDIVIDKGTGNNKKIFDEIWIKIKPSGYYIIKNWSKSNNQKTINMVGHVVSKKKFYSIKDILVIDRDFSLVIFKKL